MCVTPYPTNSSAGVSEWPEFLISARHPVEIIGGVLFVHGVAGEAAMSHSSSVDLYHAFHRQKCYELSLSESGTNPDVSDPPIKDAHTRTAEGRRRESLSDPAQLQISKVASLFKGG